MAVSLGCALAAGPLAVGSALAQGGHEGHGGMTHSAASPAAAPDGVVIRESKVQGTSLKYRLYSWAERNVMMKGMEGHVMAGMDDSGRSSHHLMVFFSGADGKELSGGKVGFVVAGPDKSEFKTLTMAMSGGYGADVPMKAKGEYTVKLKAVFGDRTLAEEFTYSVK
jgi:hypothetical protein